MTAQASVILDCIYHSAEFCLQIIWGVEVTGVYSRRTKPTLHMVTKRDIKFFLLGIAAMLIIDFVWNWEENMRRGKDAYEQGQEDYYKDNSED